MFCASLFALLVLLLCTVASDASIKVVDRGAEFLSRPDKYVGLQMKEGIEYGARLQRIPGEPHLCGGKGFNVMVPDDGRPGTYCMHYCFHAMIRENSFSCEFWKLRSVPLISFHFFCFVLF